MLASFTTFWLMLLTLVRGAWAAEDPFRVEAQDATVLPGASGKVTVVVRVPDGFHVYRDMLAVKVENAGKVTAGSPAFPDGSLADDPASPGAVRELYEQDVYIQIPVSVPKGISGDIPVLLDVRYQGCKRSLCYLPGEQEVTAIVHTGGARPGLPGGGPAEEEKAVSFNAKAAGGTLTVHVDLQGEWHINRDLFSVTVPEPGGWTFGEATVPHGIKSGSPADGSEREDLSKDFDVTLPFSGSGPADLKVDVYYQACKGTQLCRMPTTETIAVAMPTGTPAPAASPAVPDAGDGGAAAENEKAVAFSGKFANGTVVVHADLTPEWHINRGLFSVTAADAGGWTFGEAKIPAGIKTGSPADGSEREDLTADFDVVLPVSGTGAKEASFDVYYQACKGTQLCRMPTTETIRVTMQGDGTASPLVTSATPDAAKAPPQAATTAFSRAADQGFLTLLLFCFVAGIGVSFTPCVLPIVPITMGIIGARSAGSRLQAVSLAGTYVMGQAMVYTSLAVGVAMTGGIFGSWLQSVWVTGAISVFFVAMGFSMFGFFDVQVPGFIANRLQGDGARSGGYMGAAVLGMIGALIAGPCSGPVVASLLIYIGVQGNVWEGALLMFTFSLGMGLIFLVTGALAGWLPSRGAWMITVKKGMGIFLWLMAINFSSPHLSVAVTAIATAAVLLITGVFSWPDPDDGEGIYTVRLRQLYTVVGVVVGSWLLVATMATEGFILPPLKLSSAGAAAPVAGPHINWQHDHDAALAQAKASGKPMIIDFTAEWCAACHEMERETYTDGTVIAATDRFVTVMIDCTATADPQVKAIQARYGVSGLPTVVLLNADGVQVDTMVGFVPAPEFLDHLKGVTNG